jgi:hypothetical protein
MAKEDKLTETLCFSDNDPDDNSVKSHFHDDPNV